MKLFKNNVAVITGAASGIGRSLAVKAAQEKMHIVIADIEIEPLTQLAAELEDGGAKVLAIPTDVSDEDAIEHLAQQTLEAYGAVHLLCNNAGVAVGGPIWENSTDDWTWVLGVNLWGVIYGIKQFVPIMLSQQTDCHIVNTASIAGLISGAGLGVYKVAKHGVVSLSETLYHDLVQAGSRIGVSVLCPGWVDTRIDESERNRPEALQNDTSLNAPEIDEAVANSTRELLSQGLSPAHVADLVFDAVENNTLYIHTHPDWKPIIQTRMDDILQDRPPTDPSVY